MSIASLAKDPQYMSYLGSLEQKYGLPSGILATQQQAESNFNPSAVSPAGAEGIAQFMPATAKQYGIDPMNPEQAADGQARMLRDLGSKYNGDIPSVLAAYNWGSGNLDRKGMENAPAETTSYIAKIMGALPSGPDQSGQDAPGALSRMASAVGSAIIPSAQAGELQPGDTAQRDPFEQMANAERDAYAGAAAPANDNPYAQLPDDQLLAEAQKAGLKVEQPAQDFSQMSDEQLLAAAEQSGLKVEKPALQQTVERMLGRTARIGAEGLTMIPNIIGDAANAAINLGSMGINKVAGTDIPMLAYPGQTTQSALDKLGLPRAETGLEKGVDVLGQAMTGFASPGNLILEAGAKAIAPVAESAIGKVAAMFGKDTGKAVAPVEEAGMQIVQQTKLPVSFSKEQPLSEGLHDLASQSYAKADEVGGTLIPEVTNKFVAEATNAVPQTRAGKMLFGDSPAAQLVERIKGLKDSPVSLAEAQEIDEGLSDAMDGMVTKYGKLNKQGNKFLQVQTNFRNAILEAQPEHITGGKEGFAAWKEGQKYWSQMLKARDVEKIMQRAEQMEVPATGIKTGFRTLLSNPSRTRGWTKPELAAARHAAKHGVLTGTLKLFGSRLIPIGASVAGGAVGHVPGAIVSGLATHAATSLARGAATKLQMGRAESVLKEIAKTANKGAK